MLTGPLHRLQMLAWLGLWVATAGCGAGQSSPEHAQEAARDSAITRSFTVPPGELVELNLRCEPGATVSVDYEAGAALSWNVHSHEAGRTIIHREGRDSSGSLPFTAEAAGVYSYMWKNDTTADASLTVSVTLEPGSSVHSWHP